MFILERKVCVSRGVPLNLLVEHHGCRGMSSPCPRRLPRTYTLSPCGPLFDCSSRPQGQVLGTSRVRVFEGPKKRGGRILIKVYTF